MARRKTPLAKRLMGKMVVGDDCWSWTASLDGKGYGQVRSEDGRTLRAHRAVYELLVGPIPEGLHIDHLCRNRACVNPAHLEPVTQAENNRRGDAGPLLRQRQLAKIACPQGHPYNEANTSVYVSRSGSRHRRCRACHAAQERARKAVV